MLRCPECDTVLLRLIRARGETRLDMRGVRLLRWRSTALSYSVFAPRTGSKIAYSDVVAQMYRRLRLEPPHCTFATPSGTLTLPINVPSGSQDVDAVAGAGPDVALLVEPEPVEAADRALGELAAVGELAVVGDVERAHRLVARVGDVQHALVGAEREAVRALACRPRRCSACR